MSWWLESIDLIGSTLVGAAGRLLEGIMQAVAPDTAAETEISIAEPAGSRGLIELDEVDGSGTTPQQLAREDKLRAFFSTWGKEMMAQTPAADWMTEVDKLLKEFGKHNVEVPDEIAADLSEWIGTLQNVALRDAILSAEIRKMIPGLQESQSAEEAALANFRSLCDPSEIVTAPKTLAQELWDLYMRRTLNPDMEYNAYWGSKVYTFQDDGQVRAATKMQRTHWMARNAVYGQSTPIDGQWHKIWVPSWRNVFNPSWFPRKPWNVHVLSKGPWSLGFYLGGVHTFDAKGSYEVKFEAEPWMKGYTGWSRNISVWIRNVDMEWRWNDDMDSHSGWEFGFVKSLFNMLEVAGDLLADKLLRASYNFHIKFLQQETGPISASIHETRKSEPSELGRVLTRRINP